MYLFKVLIKVRKQLYDLVEQFISVVGAGLFGGIIFILKNKTAKITEIALCLFFGVISGSFYKEILGFNDTVTFSLCSLTSYYSRELNEIIIDFFKKVPAILKKLIEKKIDE